MFLKDDLERITRWQVGSRRRDIIILQKITVRRVQTLQEDWWCAKIDKKYHWAVTLKLT